MFYFDELKTKIEIQITLHKFFFFCVVQTISGFPKNMSCFLPLIFTVYSVNIQYIIIVHNIYSL